MGERRRVDLAAGLVTRPQLLVLDEPTTGLDPRSRQVVWAAVRELVAEGVTVLLTTQYLEEADALADQIVFIDHGHSVATGTPAELRAQIGDQRVDVVASDAVGFERLVAALSARFKLTLAPERRTISVPGSSRSARPGVGNRPHRVDRRGDRRGGPPPPDPGRRIPGVYRHVCANRRRTS